MIPPAEKSDAAVIEGIAYAIALTGIILGVFFGLCLAQVAGWGRCGP